MFVASTSFDGPATTDAALAALAAEAGLIDPEPSSGKGDEEDNAFVDSTVSLDEGRATEQGGSGDTVNSTEQELMLVGGGELTGDSEMPLDENLEQQEILDDMEAESSECITTRIEGADSTATSNVVGLFGGGRGGNIVEKLGLKGGNGRFRLGLLGGSPIQQAPLLKPTRGVIGLLDGGNGDSESPNNSNELDASRDTLGSSFTANSSANSLSQSGSASISNNSDSISADSSAMSLDENMLKGEYDDNGEENDEFKLHLGSADDEDVSSQEPDDVLKDELLDKLKSNSQDDVSGTITNGSNNITELMDGKKPDESVGDPLSTLASAALGRATPQSYTKPDSQVMYSAILELYSSFTKFEIFHVPIMQLI